MRALINPTQGRLFLLAARHNPSKTWLLLSLRSVGWNLYPQFIAWVGFHLLYQHKSSYALKHSFCYFLALKSSAKRRSVNHCREQISKFPKTDAFGIFETIKKSPFLSGNFLLSSRSANASAEIWKFKIQDSKLNIKRHATEDDLSSDEWHLYTQFIA